MSVKINLITGEVKIRPVFHCDKCGALDIGGYEKYLNTQYSMEQFAESLQYSFEQQSHSSYMPIGWSSVLREGRTQHLCPRCKELPYTPKKAVTYADLARKEENAEELMRMQCPWTVHKDGPSIDLRDAQYNDGLWSIGCRGITCIECWNKEVPDEEA